MAAETPCDRGDNETTPCEREANDKKYILQEKKIHRKDNLWERSGKQGGHHVCEMGWKVRKQTCRCEVWRFERLDICEIN